MPSNLCLSKSELMRNAKRTKLCHQPSLGWTIQSMSIHLKVANISHDVHPSFGVSGRMRSRARSAAYATQASMSSGFRLG